MAGQPACCLQDEIGETCVRAVVVAVLPFDEQVIAAVTLERPMPSNWHVDSV